MAYAALAAGLILMVLSLGVWVCEWLDRRDS